MRGRSQLSLPHHRPLPLHLIVRRLCRQQYVCMVRAPQQHKEAAATMLHVAAERDHRLLREFAASGTSVACANTFLNPVGEFNAGRTCSDTFTGDHKSSQLTSFSCSCTKQTMPTHREAHPAVGLILLLCLCTTNVPFPCLCLS